MKILHSADWHLDAPLQGRSEDAARLLRNALLELPGKIAAICRAENCDMMLLSGDLFDGPYTPESLQALQRALADAAVPVFIAPGNHDAVGSDSPWTQESWPENVYIFTQDHMVATALPELNCWVCGAGFTGAYSKGLLEGFRAEDPNMPTIGILHGDPTQVTSPYCPITEQQVQDSGLDYLALGHIHKGGSFRAGKTLCAWPGCPMGRGFDEQGEKGVLIVTLENKTATTRFVAVDAPRFYDWELPVGEDAAEALRSVLPPVGNNDFYRITLTGECSAVDTDALLKAFSRFPNLELRDRTVPPLDLWAGAGDDTLEGVYFRLLQEAMEGEDEDTCRQIRLAARISRQLLSGQEVTLP